MHKKHFIIIEVETATEQSSKTAEDMVAAYLKAASPGLAFTFKSVGWLADNIRVALTGKQEI